MRRAEDERQHVADERELHDHAADAVERGTGAGRPAPEDADHHQRREQREAEIGERDGVDRAGHVAVEHTVSGRIRSAGRGAVRFRAIGGRAGRGMDVRISTRCVSKDIVQRGRPTPPSAHPCAGRPASAACPRSR